MRIIGLMVCGPNEANRYLKGTLDEFKRLCDDVVIACNNTDPQTEELITSYGFKWYRDDREWGKYQPNIKTKLLQTIGTIAPTHILALDSDETMPGVTRRDLEGLEKNFGNYFFIVNLWNDGYVPELSFWNVRFYKFDSENTAFINKPVHCGLGPPYAYNTGVYVPHIVLHYGLKNKADREKKVARYKKYDPNAIHKWQGFYDSLASQKDGILLDLVKLQEEVAADVKKMGEQKRIIQIPKTMKHFYVKRLKDGRIMDVPETDLKREPIKSGGFEVIGEAVINTANELPVIEATQPSVPDFSGPLASAVESKFPCTLCGKEFGKAQGLRMHTMKAHK